MDALELNGLEKKYPSGVHAVKGIDLRVPQGEVFGLIGPNGAGKSTTIRMIATLLKPTAGSIRIHELDVVDDEIKVRELISYLPEDAGAYENLSGREYLEFMGNFYPGDTSKMVAIGEDLASLDERLDSRIKEYSKGMKRRLLIARTLMVAPKLAILDEPTSGLDVMHGHYVRKKIKEVIRRENTTAIVSSHNLLEVEFLCTRVGLINEGRILEVGTPQELKDAHDAQNLEEVFLQVVERAGSGKGTYHEGREGDAK